MAKNPFHLDIVTKDFRWAGVLGDAEELHASPAHNAQPTAMITVPARSKKIPLLIEEGTRVEITHDGRFLMGGPLLEATGAGPAVNGTMTFLLMDDYRQLSSFLCWPVPGSPLSSQNSEYHKVSGPAETVLKSIVTANAARMGLPISCAPDLGRGARINAAMRFHTIEERLGTALDAAGIGVTVRRVGTGFVVDCYEPRSYPKTLTEESGVVTSWEWKRKAPEATDVIIGGQGEGTARVFKHFAAPDDRATRWKDRREVFRDARDSDDEGDVYATRASETFAETAQKTGLKLGLSETKNFRYGTTVTVGDKLSVQVGQGLTITDILRQADISWTRNDGEDITPTMGEFESADDIYARALKAMAKNTNDLQRSR
ncbi:hypothetical protein [Arthrobacter sp. NPDC090010]|uniref:Gp37-like protein n=1 Tax=Arthrobacter sp. NPDC090010 TaxID=3363942 RepID=UPI00381C910D